MVQTHESTQAEETSTEHKIEIEKKNALRNLLILNVPLVGLREHQ